MTILVGIDYMQRMQYLKKLSFAVHKWHNLAEWYTYDQFCSIVYLLNIFNNHIITVFATNGIFLLPLQTFFIGTNCTSNIYNILLTFQKKLNNNFAIHDPHKKPGFFKILVLLGNKAF